MNELATIAREKDRLQGIKSGLENLVHGIDYELSWLEKRRSALEAAGVKEETVFGGAFSYHRQGCGWKPADAKPMPRSEAIAKGFRPCSSTVCFRGEAA